MTARKFFILAAVLMAVSFVTRAQDSTDKDFIEHKVKWYEDIETISKLYGVPEEVIVIINKLEDTTLHSRQILLIPKSEKQWPAAGTKVAEAEDVQEAVFDTDTVQVFATTVPERKDTVNVGLLLPFINNDRSGNGNNMDFYSGVLMAVKQAGEEGINVNLNVFDFNRDEWMQSEIGENDFIIGPVRNDDIEKALVVIRDSIPVISPLDSKAARIARLDRRLVQAASSTAEQYREIAQWASEIGWHHSLARYIIVGSQSDTASLNAAVKAFEDKGLDFRFCTTGVQGEIDGWERTALPADGGGHNIAVLAIANEAILNNAVRNMSIYASEGNVTVLTGSRIRSYETIPEENIHKAEIHAVCPYYVDYTDAATLDFIHRYRSFFRNEPSQFSYQGYDLAYFMITSYSRNGKAWANTIADADKCDMLQTCIKFRKTENGALVNSGLRRIIYRQNYKVELEK